MRLNRALLFLVIVTLAFPSGHCCRGRCTRATVLAVGSAVASGIAAGIVNYWDKFQICFKTEIKEFSWSTLGLFAGKAQRQKQTEGQFSPIRLMLDPPRHNCITRSEELTELKKLFDSFDTSTDDKVVYAVHLVGLPGSGKSELARQYGNLVFKNGDVHTVITLNTESEKQFKDDLIDAILQLKAAKGTEATREEFSKKAIQSLVYELRVLMRERPGWLLIVDNIREATQRSFYEQLPKPGTEIWGQGYMLLTTQVLIRKKGQFVEIKSTNEGMTPNDAKQFLCELVRRAKGDCPDGDAETIVRKLEYLPLAILAAGTQFIEEKMKLELYSLADYQEKFDEENAKAFDITMSDYPHSMRTALLLAVRNKVEGDSAEANIFKDVFAFLGFVDRDKVMSHFVVGYLKTNGHRKGSILKLTNFTLVNYLEEKKVFRIHQVTRDAFRAELIERLNRHPASGDLLVENFRNISHFFFTRWDEKSIMEILEPHSYFDCVLSNHDYSLNDIISADENFEVAASLIFRLTQVAGNLRLPNSLFNCSELEHFVARLLSVPEKTTNTSYMKFMGCRLVRDCLQQDNQMDLSEEYAVKGAEVIKELVPESPELHTMPFFDFYDFFDFFPVIQFIQSVEPTDKEDSDRLYFSFLRVTTVLYRWNTITLRRLGSRFLKNGMLNGARVWFEEVVNRSCRSELGTGNQSSRCVEDLLDLGITYHHLEKYNAAEDILLQARQHSTTVREQDSSSRHSWPYLKYKVGCLLAKVQISLHKYSEALSSLEEVLNGYGILFYGNWTRCAEDYGGNERISLASEVLERYHSLYINVPDSLQEAMRRVERKLMELLAEILSCEYLKDLEEARRPANGRYIGPNKAYEEVFTRLHHIIKNQISLNHTRNLTELTIGVAEILLKRLLFPSSLADELRVTVTTGVTFPLSAVNLLQDSIKKQVSATLSPFTNFSLIAFNCLVSLAFLLAFFQCVEHAPCDRPFTLILIIAFGTVLILLSVGYYAHL